ncbi:MAG TPA: PIN domain-containing protein [Candidatus Limnocylindrales bacterium]|nr:PIN domain-containing protein [Candidatus Limnocylindrales bacterium]
MEPRHQRIAEIALAAGEPYGFALAGGYAVRAHGNPAADCVGVINDADEFALWLSPYVLENTIRVLCDHADWSKEDAEAYAKILMRLAEHSGGGTLVPPRTVHDCQDFEDNLVLDLAVETGAFLIVSEDSDLTSMSPWRGTPILRPREFAARVDAMRRHKRRR